MGKNSRIFRHLAALRSLTAVIGLACAVPGCADGPRSPVAPAGTPAPVSPPPAPALGAPPTITAVVPDTGSAAGGATLKILGSGFKPGMIATFDGIKVMASLDWATSSTTFYAETPAHAAGTVDLVVTNPDGQSHGIAAGYTYAAQESFALNGAWEGWTLNGTDTWVAFVIRDNRLVSASCAYEVSMPFVFSDLPTIQGGEFSVGADGGATLSGRIVSVSEIVGTISFPGCTTAPLPWRANRKSDAPSF